MNNLRDLLNDNGVFEYSAALLRLSNDAAEDLQIDWKFSVMIGKDEYVLEGKGDFISDITESTSMLQKHDDMRAHILDRVLDLGGN